MSPIRFRISRLMLVVGLVAINLAAFRTLFASRRIDVLFGGTMLWVAFEFGVFRAVRHPGPRRSFWVGFVGFGVMATLSYVAAVQHPHSVAGSIWRIYLVRVEGVVIQAIEASYRSNGHPAVHELLSVVTFTLGWFLPLILAAVVGGYSTRRALRDFRRKLGSASGPSLA